MSRDTSEPTDESNRTLRDWSRRTVLKVTGGSLALAGLGGASVVGADQEGDDEDDENGENGDDGQNGDGGQDSGDDSTFVEDLVDPTWGYPLAADETDRVDLDNVVEMVTIEGEGPHENFPLNPETGEPFPTEFIFDPVGIHVRPGSVVQFVSTAGEHTATAFHEKFSIPQRPVPTRVPDGVEGFTSPPVVDGESWLYQFPTEGVYDIFCLPHLVVGMVMRVVVCDPDDDAAGDSFDAPSAGDLSPNVQRVFGAEELEPANIVDEGTVAWEDLTLTEE